MNQPALLALILLLGFAGGYWIARKVSGGTVALVWLAWLASPLLVLAVVLAGETDSTLPADRASYNFAFGFVLYGFLILIPWLPANLVGALLGRKARRKVGPDVVTMPATSTPVAAGAPADDGLPDWNKADNPRLTYQEIHDRIADLAARAGIDRASLPRFSPPDGSDGEFIFLDKFDYIYAGIESGRVTFEHPTVVVDYLCYVFLRARAPSLAAERLGSEAQEEGAEQRLATIQQEILAAIDPRWGAQFALELAFAARQ